MTDSTADLPVLEGPALPPSSGATPEQIVILLHGVGSDGNDLIGLAPIFQQVLPNALFISPNAPQAFDMAPVGYQWFSLQDMSPDARLTGAQGTAPTLDKFLDRVLETQGLTEDRLALIGFSQGTMMSLHVGLRRKQALAGILGYSGMLVGSDLLADEIASRPPVMLVHGDADEVLPVAALADAEAGLKAVDVSVETHVRPGLGHGIDDDAIKLGMRFLSEIFEGS